MVFETQECDRLKNTSKSCWDSLHSLLLCECSHSVWGSCQGLNVLASGQLAEMPTAEPRPLRVGVRLQHT